MRLSVGMEARQVQTQKLAPKMIQSMEILQLPIMALEERIEQELIENPTLEYAEDEPDELDESDQDVTDGPTEDEKELIVGDDGKNVEDFERLETYSSEHPEEFEDFRPSRDRQEQLVTQHHDLMANRAARPESLNDFLLHQLGELELDSDVEELAERIISMLDARDGGYFRGSLRDVLPADHTEEDLQRAEEALRVVQSLDPPGIAARNLQECLLNQLSPDDPDYADLKKLIENHLEDLAANRLPHVESKTGIPIERINALREQLHRLNPKPGIAFLQTHVPLVPPDVIVEPDDNGDYIVRLVDDRIPPLRINAYYKERLADPNLSKEEKEFLRKKLESANWMIEAIEQRKSTIKKVAQAIVDHQRKFFDLGPEHIEPLKMQQIADRVGVHVTTISRAVDDKWMQTPRGLFPMKRFFVHGTRSEDGEDVAWETIRMALQELIDNEDKANPYSDDDLRNKLREKGFNVARRTITKYRRRLGIPSSRQRKDWTKVKQEQSSKQSS